IIVSLGYCFITSTLILPNVCYILCHGNSDERKYTEHNFLHPFSKLLTLVAYELVEMIETY
ncbi:unnamed protein product, partial [Bubo scandiacus]